MTPASDPTHTTRPQTITLTIRPPHLPLTPAYYLKGFFSSLRGNQNLSWCMYIILAFFCDVGITHGSNLSSFAKAARFCFCILKLSCSEVSRTLWTINIFEVSVLFRLLVLWTGKLLKTYMQKQVLGTLLNILRFEANRTKNQTGIYLRWPAVIYWSGGSLF